MASFTEGRPRRDSTWGAAARRGPALRRILALGLLLAAPARAGAAGYYIGDIGSRAQARGGAFVAAPDSLLAMHYNPAGLSLLSGLHVEGDLTAAALSASFDRTCPCVQPGPGVSAASFDPALMQSFAGHAMRTATPLWIPYIGVAYGFQPFDFTVGLAAYGPNSGAYAYGQLPPASSPLFTPAAMSFPGRYTALAVDTLEANIQLALAFQPFHGLRLGFSLMDYVNGVDQKLNLWVNSATFGYPPENAQFDLPIELSFRRWFAINWSAGAIITPVDNLDIGVSFRAKRTIVSDGNIDLALPPVLTGFGVMVTGRAITIETASPPLARAGIQYQRPGIFKVEGAVVWEGWSVYDKIVITPTDITVDISGKTQKLGKIVMPRGWRNTASFRLGGEIDVLEPVLGIQLGAFYEPTAIPADRVDISRLDFDKIGLAGGLSTTWSGVTLQAAVTYVLLPSTNVNDSTVQLTGPLSPPLGTSMYNTTIGNGAYAGHYVLASASLAFALDPLLGR